MTSIKGDEKELQVTGTDAEENQSHSFVLTVTRRDETGVKSDTSKASLAASHYDGIFYKGGLVIKNTNLGCFTDCKIE